MSEHVGVAAIEVAAVGSWIRDRVGSLTPPFTWTRLKGGHSNLTYRITDLHGNDAVVRRPPLGQLLPTAHDMGREFRLISALAPTAVPVAPPIAFCEDSSVTGAPFYVIGFVDGQVLYTLNDTRAYVPEQHCSIGHAPGGAPDAGRGTPGSRGRRFGPGRDRPRRAFIAPMPRPLGRQ